MKVELTSFGYKFGIYPAEIILDMRCLENPYWVPELRDLNGLDPRVLEYIFSFPACRAYVERLGDLICMQAELAKQHDRSSLRIGVGCTGGRHRSVAVMLYLADRLREQGFETTVSHRDLLRG